MRADVSDAMDDTFAEDTLMDCETDDQDYLNSVGTSNITKSPEKIQGAVEKLLTLLESNEEDDEELSCSDDEGVEADLSETEECSDDSSNFKVLYQLAVLLTEDLKCNQKLNWQSNDSRNNVDTVKNMEVIERANNQHNQFSEKIIPKQNNDQILNTTSVRLSSTIAMDNISLWMAGWDSCTSEALRYLVEVEGLPIYHPTILAMKNHLLMQRNRYLCKV